MRSILSSTLLIALILFVVTGCSLKKAEPIKPEPVAKVQPQMKKLEYFGSDAVAVNIPPKSLEEEMGEAPSAVGEFQPVLSPEEAAAQITEYALRAKNGERALPLFAHWDTGARSDIEGMSPEFMLSLVEQGHHALVAWELDPYWASYIPLEYYERSIKRAAELKLPLVLVAGSFALPLLEDSSYAKQKNILIGGALGPKGATKTWQAAGKKWMQSELMQKLQEWYPNPPLVVFLSRSEAPHASAASVGMSNKAYGDAWFERYRALHTGMKSALRKEWSDNTIFVGRNTFANPDMGKSDEWMKLDETYVEGTLSVWPLIFDGASVDFVMESGEDDTSLNSPHASANSLPFLLDDTKLLNNDFWWEATIGAPAISADAERYRGFAQFDLWLNRPSVLREAAIEHEDNASVMEHFVQLIDSVEMVHKSDILQEFWHNGTLVKNPNVTNPHDKNIPEMYRGELGWYMLDTDAQGVWAFALVKGEEPNREWLVFVQSGAEELPEALHVSIPEYQDVVVSVGKAGEFFLVSELDDHDARSSKIKSQKRNMWKSVLKSIPKATSWTMYKDSMVTQTTRFAAIRSGSNPGVAYLDLSQIAEIENGSYYNISVSAHTTSANKDIRMNVRNFSDTLDASWILSSNKKTYNVKVVRNIEDKFPYINFSNAAIGEEIIIDEIAIEKKDSISDYPQPFGFPWLGTNISFDEPYEYDEISALLSQLKTSGAKQIRINIVPEDYLKQGHSKNEFFLHLEERINNVYLPLFKLYDLSMILGLENIPYDSEECKNKRSEGFWDNEICLQNFRDSAHFIANAFKNVPDKQILAYQFMSEPVWNGEGTPPIWRELSEELVDIVREYDENRFVIWSRGEWGFSKNYYKTVPLDDPRVIYNFHIYDPMPYTHQGINGNQFGVKYTDKERKAIENAVGEMVEFREKNNNIPILLGAYGVSCWISDRIDWLKDLHTLLEENKIASLQFILGDTYKGWDLRYTSTYRGPDSKANYQLNTNNEAWVEQIRYWNHSSSE